MQCHMCYTSVFLNEKNKIRVNIRDFYRCVFIATYEHKDLFSVIEIIAIFFAVLSKRRLN